MKIGPLGNQPYEGTEGLNDQVEPQGPINISDDAQTEDVDVLETANEEDVEPESESQTNKDGEDFQRAVGKVRDRGNRKGFDNFQRIGELFFGAKNIDPLDDKSIEEAQEINEGVGKRAETAAKFTENATTLVTAGLPGPAGGSAVPAAGAKGATMIPSTGVTAGQIAVGEGVSQATDQTKEPGILGKIFNFLSNLFK